MRLTTWNVNGIRNPFSYPPWNTNRTFPHMFDTLASDIIVMQELKIQRKDLRDDMVLLDGWDCYFSLPRHKKGYSGVGVYTRNAICAPIRAEEGVLGVLPSPNGVAYCDLPEEESIGGYPTAVQTEILFADAENVTPAGLDAEGRCVVLEFPAFVLFGVYSPANSNGLRDSFRVTFLKSLDTRIRNLVALGKTVVLVGDLNVSRDEIDTAGAADECRKEGISHEEYISTPNRRIFNQLIIGGEVFGERDEGREQGVLIDTTRAFHPERQGMYTHWEQKKNARPGNFGGRIDFVLVDQRMEKWVRDGNIQEGLLGSDHCPVYADFHAKVEMDGMEVHLIDVMNPQGTFVEGERRKEWRLADIPAFSAKRMPEFQRRRSIKSMFGGAPSIKKMETTEEEPAPVAEQPTPMITNGSATNKHVDAPIEAQSPPLKRKISTPVREKAVKRQKSDGSGKERTTISKGGQQSLKGFFQTQNKKAISSADTSPAKTDVEEDILNPACSQPPATPSQHPPPASQQSSLSHAPTPILNAGSTEILSAPSPASPTPSPTHIATQILANETNARSWSTLFKPPPAPVCEGHNEPCVSFQTKKKGSNQGRRFWMCGRPLGPTGKEERRGGVGGGWRCGTWVWASDWTGKGSGDGVG